MIEKLADLWTEPCDARVITTNGFIKKNGSLVMGAGVAGQAQARYPNFPKVAGLYVQLHGNHVFPYEASELRNETMFAADEPDLWYITYPVKHNWFEQADLALIERSAHELMKVVDRLSLTKVLLPLPGCGNGQLRWRDVKPVIAPILDERVWAINNQITQDFDPQENYDPRTN